MRIFKNIDYKYSPIFWGQFSKHEHYFKSFPLLGELKLCSYLNFLKQINLASSVVLKTDLYVEAKNERDNFLPFLKIGRCVGIDISLDIVKAARNNLSVLFPNMQFVVADVRNLPFKEKSFGAVISDSTLDHFPVRDISANLVELKRVIKYNGKLILSLDNIFNFGYAF